MAFDDGMISSEPNSEAETLEGEVDDGVGGVLTARMHVGGFLLESLYCPVQLQWRGFGFPVYNPSSFRPPLIAYDEFRFVLHDRANSGVDAAQCVVHRVFDVLSVPLLPVVGKPFGLKFGLKFPVVFKLCCLSLVGGSGGDDGGDYRRNGDHPRPNQVGVAREVNVDA
jgi:hypothetical protein